MNKNIATSQPTSNLSCPSFPLSPFFSGALWIEARWNQKASSGAPRRQIWITNRCQKGTFKSTPSGLQRAHAADSRQTKIHHDLLSQISYILQPRELRNPTGPAACHMLDLHPKGLDQHSWASGSQLLSKIEVLYLKPRNGFPRCLPYAHKNRKNCIRLHTAGSQMETVHRLQRYCLKITFGYLRRITERVPHSWPM